MVLVRVLVAMSGGVDSSVAAALLVEQGHEVVGATLKLWGGESDSGCCSVADVEDARRVANQLGITHHVFNFTDTFEHSVVGPYVDEHSLGRIPNPCIECNRSVKFGVLLERTRRLGFDRLATGHHARLEAVPAGDHGNRMRLLRGADAAKDQSYVLSMLGREQLEYLAFPVGVLTKDEVRRLAGRLGLRTAGKPDSQEVCFIHSGVGREGFLTARTALHPGELVDVATKEVVGTVAAVELVTPGQRRGLGVTADGRRRYALAVDVLGRRVLVGGVESALATHVEVETPTWVDRSLEDGGRAMAQTSAHGRPAPFTWESGCVRFDEPQRLVAPGQTVAFYDLLCPEAVLGAAKAA